jgi:hypothetical protein
VFAPELAPATRAIVGDDLPEHREEGALVERVVLAEPDRPGRVVVVAGGDDALGIGDDRPVVEEDVDVILRREEGADIAVEDEIRLDRSLDRLLDVGVGLVDDVPDLAEDLPLPVGQAVQVVVDAWILDVRDRRSSPG